MKSTNFDYFISRASIIEEMGRQARGLGITSPEINSAYGQIRKNIRTKNPTLNASSVDLIAFRFIAKQIYDLLSDNEQEEYDKVKKSRMTYVPFVTGLINQLLQHGEDANKIANSLLDAQELSDFMDYLEVNKGGRAKGKDTEFELATKMGNPKFVELSQQLGPAIRTMNAQMGSRKLSRLKSGEKSKYNVQAPQEEEDTITPNVQNAINISTVLSKISTLRSGLRQSGKLYDKTPPSLWAPKDDKSLLVQLLKNISDKEFDASISLLMDLLEVKIDAGTGQTTSGFLKLVDKIKSHPTTSESLSKLFDHIVSDIQLGMTQDIYTTVEDENKFEGYDREVIQKVLPDSEDQKLFSDWLSAHRAWREALDQKFNLKFEKQRLNSFLDSRGLNNPTPEAPPQEEKVAESVQYSNDLLYMEDQFNKDLKFKSSPGKFSERGFKKFKNYNHWLIINDNI